jgi:hypothetical protein
LKRTYSHNLKNEEFIMHCPDCGTRATTNQKFCRSCGFSLEKVAQLLTEQSSLTASSQLSDDDVAQAQRRLKKLEGWLCLGAGGLLITVVGAAIWGIIQNLIIEEGEVLPGILLIAFMLIVVTIAFSASYVLKQREKLTGRNPRGPILSPYTETTNPLPLAASADSPASVTEHTTARLEERAKPAS